VIRRTRRLAVALTVVAVVAVAPMAAASAAFAQSSGSSGSGAGEVLATLKVTADKVEVKKDGAEKFKAAKDGEKLRQGDTVRTDATGTAEIDYAENSYTRLDVSTTFKIKKLTEDQGSRQVQGSLEQGQAWNRTEAITESGSFGTDGAGANATVRGTAYSVSCDSPDHCVFTAVYHDTELTGTDGQTKLLNPLDQCDSTSGELCGAVEQLTLEQAIANKWIQDNLLKDYQEHGFGPGPFHLTGTIVVENGQVVSFTTTPTPPATPAPAPIFDNANPVFVESFTCGASVVVLCGASTPTATTSGLSCDSPPAGYECASGLTTEDEYELYFKVNVSDPGNLAVTVRFPTLPDADVAKLCAPLLGHTSTNACTFGPGDSVAAYEAIVDDPSATFNTTTEFSSDTTFALAPTDYEDSENANTSSFTVAATNSAGSSATSDPVPVTVTEDEEG
jgi:hypothetical protein